MPFLLKRFSCFANMTYGRLYNDDGYVCDTFEGRDLFLEDRLPEAEGVVSRSADEWVAVPRGMYTFSNMYSARYGERLPVLTGVPGFSGVCMIGERTRANGCIHVGIYDYDCRLMYDTDAMLGKVMRLLDAAGEDFITVR